jgi:hypothetical protein
MKAKDLPSYPAKTATPAPEIAEMLHLLSESFERLSKLEGVLVSQEEWEKRSFTGIRDIEARSHARDLVTAATKVLSDLAVSLRTAQAQSRAPFLTGSRAYGKPDEDSDIDMVIRTPDDKLVKVLEELGGDAPCRFGQLNLVICKTDDEYDRWLFGTLGLKSLPTKPTRDEAIGYFNTKVHDPKKLKVWSGERKTNKSIKKKSVEDMFES